MDPFAQFVTIPFIVISISVAVAFFTKRVIVAPILAFVLKILANYIVFTMSGTSETLTREMLFHWSFVTALIATIFGMYLFLSLGFLERRRRRAEKNKNSG